MSCEPQPPEKKVGRDFAYEDVCFLCSKPKEVIAPPEPEPEPEPEAPPTPKAKKTGKGKKQKEEKEEPEVLPPPVPKAPKVHPVLQCSVCPRAYHPDCLVTYYTKINQPKAASDAEALVGVSVEKEKYISYFVCPQHRCLGCLRNTASAGGLLFRCAEVSNGLMNEAISLGIMDHDKKLTSPIL